MKSVVKLKTFKASKPRQRLAYKGGAYIKFVDKEVAILTEEGDRLRFKEKYRL